MDLGKIRLYKEMRFNFNNKHYLIKLCSYKTAEGFNHKGDLFLITYEEGFFNEDSIAKKVIKYFNRTWERFTFESVILGVFNKAFKDDYLIAFNNFLEHNEASSYKKDLNEGSVI
jgi:hypothetical protein